jgi:phosphoserine phosphatase
MGDATGHGIGPALSATQVRAMLRVAQRLGAGLDDAFRHINDQLADDLSANRFVTAFLGLLDVASHRLTYHAGGQGPILHFHAARADATLSPATTLPMGMMTIFKPAESRVAILEPGDVVAAITDGIYEYENPVGKMFGDQRVVELIRAEAGASAERILHRIVDEVTAFAAGAPQNDDMTLLIVKRTT